MFFKLDLEATPAGPPSPHDACPALNEGFKLTGSRAWSGFKVSVLSFGEFISKLDQFCGLVCHIDGPAHAGRGQGGGRDTYVGIACERNTHQAVLQNPRQHCLATGTAHANSGFPLPEFRGVKGEETDTIPTPFACKTASHPQSTELLQDKSTWGSQDLPFVCIDVYTCLLMSSNRFSLPAADGLFQSSRSRFALLF